jgi:hypothetical protein
MNADANKLIQLGYRVEAAVFEDADRPTVYYVEGFGLSTYVGADEEATWRSLVESHECRVDPGGCRDESVVVVDDGSTGDDA